MRGLLLQVWTVLGTELRLHARDRRSLLSALLVPLLGPLLFAFSFSTLAARQGRDGPLLLPVAGREHAPGLVAFLERHGAQVEAAPADYEAQVREGALDLVLVIPPDYGADFSAGAPARLELVLDRSRDASEAPLRRVRTLLEQYAGLIGAQRLVARGVAPTLVQPLAVEQVDLSTPEALAARLLRFFTVFLVMAAFGGAMGVAIDTTAGERERASLEPLLLNPVDRRALVAGKWLAAATAGGAAVVLCLAAFAVALQRLPLEELGVKLVLGPVELGVLLLVMLPVVLMGAGLQLLVATYARSFKEAQTYLSLLMMVPMLPGLLLSTLNVQGQAWMYAVPVLAQDTLIAEVLRQGGLPPAGFVASAVTALALAALLVGGTVRLFGQERIVFGR